MENEVAEIDLRHNASIGHSENALLAGHTESSSSSSDSVQNLSFEVSLLDIDQHINNQNGQDIDELSDASKYLFSGYKFIIIITLKIMNIFILIIQLTK